jgi:hypothetical protein
MRDLDLSAFDPNAVVSADSVAEVEKRIREAPKKWAKWARGRGTGLGCLVPIAVVVGGALLFYAVMALTGQIEWDEIEGGPIAAGVGLGVAFGILILVFAGLVTFIASIVTDRRSPESLVRVLAFAEANGLEFFPESTARDFHGRVWDEGTTYRLEHLVGPDIDYGTVGRTDKDGVTQNTGIGYLAIRLDRKLPHIVLMRRRGARFYAGDGPEFALEGDFGRHFELHVPPGYERDALYVLTPDVMQALIDEAADQRVEIVDDRLFVFGPRVDVTDPATHARMHRIGAVLAGEIRPQTDAYRDDRARRDARRPLAIDRVAPAGRRLAPVVWIPGVLIVLVVFSAPFWGVIAQAITDASAR